MTDKPKSAKRQDLEKQAAEHSVAFDDKTTNGALEEAILAAMEAAESPKAKPKPEAAPEPENAAPEGDDVPEREMLPPIEGIHNKLIAYGIAKEECPDTLEECEMLLKQVLKARAKAAEKRKQKDEGDHYGKKAKVRITKMGDGKVGTGRYIAGIGNMCYSQGDTPVLDLSSAETLEERGFAEIEERR
jgi:hypothetical protein